MALFGPKIGTYVDFSFFSCFFVFVLCSRGHLRVNKETKPVLIGIVVLILYSLLVTVVSQTIDYLFIFKFIRAFVSALAIFAYVSNSKLEKSEMINSVTMVLLLHAMIVIVGTLVWPELQNVIRPLSGYTKMIRPLRSTGLTNGYDFAGMLCCFGIIATYFGDRSRTSTIRLIVFIVASFLTSRFSMLITEGIILYIIVMNRNRERVNKRLLTILFLVSIIPILGIFLFSVKSYDNPFVSLMMRNEYFKEYSSQLVYYYNSDSIGDSVVGHYNFSSLTTAEIVFGAMKESHQDPGITQFIFEIGIVGLVLTVYFYLRMIVISIRSRMNDQDLSIIVVLIGLLCVVMSGKISYLLARHVTECLFVFYAILVSNRYRSDELLTTS